MLELLRSLEWYSEHPRDGTPLCPVCRRAGPTEGNPSAGHAPDCRLDRVIREMAPEPTVDEMAREMELDRVTYTDDAIRTLYREHKAKQGRLVIDPASPMLNEPPTDPTALAAWLYARVVPGRTVAEVRFPDEGPESKFIVDRVDLWPDDGRVTVTSADKSTMAGTEAITRLLNPDGTVLWEGKPMPTKESK